MFSLYGTYDSADECNAKIEKYLYRPGRRAHLEVSRDALLCLYRYNPLMYPETTTLPLTPLYSQGHMDGTATKDAHKTVLARLKANYWIESEFSSPVNM